MGDFVGTLRKQSGEKGNADLDRQFKRGKLPQEKDQLAVRHR